MTQKDKNQLFKDLCARLPYGVKFTLSDDSIYTMKGIDLIVTDEGNWEYAVAAKGIDPIEIEYVKPYLRPMSSMTKEEMTALRELGVSDDYAFHNDIYDIGVSIEDAFDAILWLLKRHFDINHLIEKGLALEAPEGMYE